MLALRLGQHQALGDAIEHRGEHFTITRRGKVVAQLEPVGTGRGLEVKQLLAARRPDKAWSDDLSALRDLVVPQERS